MELNSIIGLLILHFISDFILQSDWMAQNKSNSNKVLGLHVLTYSIPFLLIGPTFAVVNGIFHFITDYVTSRITKRLWAKKRSSLVLCYNRSGSIITLHSVINIVSLRSQVTCTKTTRY